MLRRVVPLYPAVLNKMHLTWVASAACRVSSDGELGSHSTAEGQPKSRTVIPADHGLDIIHPVTNDDLARRITLLQK
jgi:hypothetical protein